jgi:hypothetical protein
MQGNRLSFELFQPFDKSMMQVLEGHAAFGESSQPRDVRLLMLVGKPQKKLVRCKAGFHNAQDTVETVFQSVNFF